MTLDDVIRHNEKLLAELEARQDLARAAEALQRTQNEKSAPKLEHAEAKATPPEHDAPQTYQTQTYEVTAPNEVVVTQETRLPESSQDIQALIDIVKKNLALLEQIKDAKEVDKESVTQLIIDWKEANENNEYYQKHFKEMMTPDHGAQFAYDANPAFDPLTTGILFAGVAVGLVSDSMEGKWITETAKGGLEAAKELYEIYKEDQKEVIKDAVDKTKDMAEKALETAKDLASEIGDPALVAKEKEQAAAREKLEADLKKQMELQEKRWEQQGKGEDEKAALTQKAEKAAQAMRDKMIADQAKELERMRQMEEAHRPRW